MTPYNVISNIAKWTLIGIVVILLGMSLLDYHNVFNFTWFTYLLVGLSPFILSVILAISAIMVNILYAAFSGILAPFNQTLKDDNDDGEE
jgi:uncharacterized paraquat-inducible protein A